VKRTAAFVAVAVLVASCSSSAKKSDAPTATTAATNASADAPVYAKAGPYKVGYIKLRLPDRDVYVWYPADDAAVAGKPKATYDQATPLPANLKGLVPPKYNKTVTMDAYADAPGNTKGPFPVALFSHGYGAYPLANSTSEVGIASWGFVVASVDYFERGLANQVLNKKYPNDPTRDPRLMLASLDLLGRENARAGSVLHGIVDMSKVGAIGHSAGGNTAFDALKDSRIAVAIGYAPVAPDGRPANKPTMIIAGSLDNALTPADLTKEYASFPAPKRRIQVQNAGHNTFTDVCDVIRSGGGLVKFALDNHIITPQLASLASNGCAKANMPPAEFLPVVQHFTVAELRAALGIDPQPVGLGDGIIKAFPGVTMTYQHQP
jgi:predicted dienelactone hydrolase